MSDFLNDAGNGLESTVVSTEQQPAEKPVSIRDSLKAALDGNEPDTSAPSLDRRRDEAGRFAKDNSGVQQPTPAATATPAQAAATPAAQSGSEAQQPAAASAARVPPGWSAEAKAQFGTLSPEVQAAISKREEEIDNGFKVLQDYKGLEEFTPLIKQGNTTHADVMRKALDYEKALQRDPVGTVLHVARIGGININALAQAIVSGNIPTQPAPQQQQVRQQPQPQINVEQTVEHVLKKRDVDTQVNAFLADPANVHAEAVLDDMVALISAGRAANLKDAYDAACWMRPDIRQQLINQAAPANPAINQQTQRAAAADQARKASRSLAGSSAPGPTKDQTPGKPQSVRDSLRSAMASSAGQV
ncbi:MULTISPECIES: hypothetical protein [unclassified Rhizobium]|uniref:hypothetical protein n=1 Tax=unclassified Rhizobium TaxID=2613769 RepID=UPI00380D632D